MKSPLPHDIGTAGTTVCNCYESFNRVTYHAILSVNNPFVKVHFD